MLRKTVLTTLACILVLFAASSAFAQSSFGEKWKSYDVKQKDAFMLGFASCVRLMCNDVASEWGKQSDVEAVKKKTAQCFNMYVGFNPATILTSMDEFYADPKNANIPFEGIYRITLMKLGGIKYDDILTKSRQYGAALKKSIDAEAKKQ